MDDSSYDEEEVEEVWEEDDDDEGFMDSLQASFASFQSLAQERKQQQQQGSGPMVSPRRMRVENQFAYETIYSDDDEAEEEEEEEEIEDVHMEEGEKGQEFEDYEYDDTDDDDDNDEDFLLRVRRQMQQLFQERKAKAVAAASSLVSTSPDDEEYEEQVIERWFGRDTLPDDLEGACRMLIPIVCKNGDEQLDPETMIRRTPLEELYRYLKQHYDYKKDVRHELTEAEQHTIETSATTTNHHQQTSLADIFLQRSTELAGGGGGRRASEPWSPEQARQQLVFLGNINDESRASITYEEVLETSGGGAQWMEESGLSYVDYVLTESAVLEETMYESEVEEDTTDASEERRYEDDDQVVEETIRDEDDNEDEMLSFGGKSVGGASQAGDTNVNIIDAHAGESSSATGDMMVAGRDSKGYNKVSESFAFANLQSRWKTQTVDPDGINHPVIAKPEVKSMSAAKNKGNAISNEAMILAEPEGKRADATQISKTKSISSHSLIARKPEMKAHVATDVRTQLKSTAVALLANTGSNETIETTTTKEIQISNDTAQFTNSSRATRTEEDFAFSNLRSKWKTASDDLNVSSGRKHGRGVPKEAVPGSSKLPSDKSSIANLRSALGNQESAIIHSRTEFAAGKSNKVIVEGALVKHVDSTPSASKDGMVSSELHSVTGRLRSTGKVDHAPQDTISSPVARWKAREATEVVGRNPPREDASRIAKDQPFKLLPSRLPTVDQDATRSLGPVKPVATWKANLAGTVHGDGEVGRTGPSATSTTIKSSFVPSNPVAIWKASRAAAVQDIQETKSAKMDVSTNSSLASAKSKWVSADEPNSFDTPSAKPVAIWKASRAAASQNATKVSPEKADRSSATSIKARRPISGTSAGSIDPSPSVGKSKWTPPPGGRSNTSSSFASPAVTDTVVMSPVSTIKLKWTAPTSASLSPVLADPKRVLKASPLSRKLTMASEFMRAASASTKVVTPAAHPGQKKTVTSSISGDTATSSSTTSSSSGIMVPGTSAKKKWEPNSKDPVLPTVPNEGLTSMEKQKSSKWKINPTGSDDNKNNMLLSSRHPTNSSPQGVPKIASKMTTPPWSKAAAVAADPIVNNDKSLVAEAGAHKLTLSLGATKETSSDPNVMLIAKSLSVDQLNSPTILKKWTPNAPRVIIGTKDETTPVVGSTQRVVGASMDTVSATTKAMNPAPTVVGSKQWAGGATQDTVAGKTQAFGSTFAAVRSKQLPTAGATQDNILGEHQGIVPEAIVVEPKHWAKVGATKPVVSEKNKAMIPSSTIVGSKQGAVAGATKRIVSEKTKVTVPPTTIAGSKPLAPAGSTKDAISGITEATVPSSVVGSKPWAKVRATEDEVLSGTTTTAVPSSTVAGSKQWTPAGAIRDGISATTKANAPSTSEGNAMAPESNVVGSKQWAPVGAAKDAISGAAKATVPSSAVIGSKPWATTAATKDTSKDAISGTTKATVPSSTVIGSKPWATTGATKNAISGTATATAPSSTVVASKPWSTTGTTKDSTKDDISDTTKTAVPLSIGSKQWSKRGPSEDGLAETSKQSVPSSNTVIPPDQNPEEESFAFSNLRSKFRGRVG